MNLTLTVLTDTFAVCRFTSDTSIPDWAYKSSFYSITRSADELSVVCSQKYIQGDGKIDKGWRVLKVEGPLDFSLVGIMANLSGTLAAGGVSIFVISTFDTDYLLVKEENLQKAQRLLVQTGHIIQTSK